MLESGFLGRSESLLAVDEMVQRLVRNLRNTGELADTYFIFTSDNGYLLGEHGLRGKDVAYEEAVRVPLIVRGPGVDAGTTNASLVANVDLAPTITELAKASPERKLDGRSLVSTLRGDDSPVREGASARTPGRPGGVSSGANEAMEAREATRAGDPSSSISTRTRTS